MLGLNRTVGALSVARLADALGNSLLFLVIPLYVAKLPAPWFPWSDEMRAGFLISLVGCFCSAHGLSTEMSRRRFGKNPKLSAIEKSIIQDIK